MERLQTPLSVARLDRTQFSLVDLDQADDDREYWLARTPDERMEALELLREIAYGYNPLTDRLQRVFELVELGAR